MAFHRRSKSRATINTPLDAPASGMKAKICNAPINIECRTRNVEVLSMAGWDVCVNKATNSSLFTRVNPSKPF